MLLKSKYTPTFDSQQLSEWKQLSFALDSLPIENIDDAEAKRIKKIINKEKKQMKFTIQQPD